MIKLRSSIAMKKIILAGSFLIAPTLAFSSEGYEDQFRPTDEQLQIMQEFANEGEFLTYSIESKSKQGSQALMGEWNISYTYNGSQTDKIVIDGAETMNDGEIVSIGSYYPDQTGEKMPLMCLDENAASYICIAFPPAGVNFVGFIFSISGNSIDRGFFSTAPSIDGVFDGFVSPQYPITGSRGITEPVIIVDPPVSIGPEDIETPEEFLAKCVTKFPDYVGTKEGEAFPCDNNTKICQNTSGGRLMDIRQIFVPLSNPEEVLGYFDNERKQRYKISFSDIGYCE